MNCLCRKASKHLHSPISKNDIKTHKVIGSIPLPAARIYELQDEVWKEWANLPPTENNLDRKLRALRENGFGVIVATSRPKRLTDCVVDWLRMMHIDYDSFYALGPRRTKTVINADALVDDAPEQIGEFVRAGRKGFIYSQPWNVNVKVRKAIRIDKIDDLMLYLDLVEWKRESSKSLLDFGSIGT